MSGTARLIGHRVEILADTPIVGPLPTQTVCSVDTTVKNGYEPTVFQAAPTVTQVIPAVTTQVMTIAGLTTTPYFPSTAKPTDVITPTASLAANTITVNAKSFVGEVMVQLIPTTNKAAPLVPVENMAIIVTVTDGLALNVIKNSVFPITIPTGSNNTVCWTVPFFVPYLANRTVINFQVAVSNFQTANTLSILNTSYVQVIQTQ